jgi:hypothetical protein
MVIIDVSGANGQTDTHSFLFESCGCQHLDDQRTLELVLHFDILHCSLDAQIQLHQRRRIFGQPNNEKRERSREQDKASREWVIGLT